MKKCVLLFGTCSKKLKKDESESSPHLVASTSRLFEINFNFIMYYKTLTHTLTTSVYATIIRFKEQCSRN
jgi:hypothetical protein